jgi:acetyl esterase/lipase
VSFRNQSQYLASQGIAGVRISYSLIPQGGTYQTAMEQIRQALDFLKEKNGELRLNLASFGFCGSSAGAVLSGIASMTVPGCKVLIGQDGAYDMVNTSGHSFPSPSVKKRFYGTTDREELQQLSAIHNIPANPPAVLLMHGSADTVIDRQESEKMADALKKRNVTVEYHLYAGYEHACTAYADIYQDVVKTMLAFAKRHLR